MAWDNINVHGNKQSFVVKIWTNNSVHDFLSAQIALDGTYPKNGRYKNPLNCSLRKTHRW